MERHIKEKEQLFICEAAKICVGFCEWKYPINIHHENIKDQKVKHFCHIRKHSDGSRMPPAGTKIIFVDLVPCDTKLCVKRAQLVKQKETWVCFSYGRKNEYLST